MEETEMADEYEIFQSFIENQDKGSKTPEQIFQEHFEVQEEEKGEEQLQYVPEDEISQIGRDYVSQNEVSEEEDQDELIQLKKWEDQPT